MARASKRDRAKAACGERRMRAPSEGRLQKMQASANDRRPTQSEARRPKGSGEKRERAQHGQRTRQRPQASASPAWAAKLANPTSVSKPSVGGESGKPHKRERRRPHRPPGQPCAAASCRKGPGQGPRGSPRVHRPQCARKAPRTMPPGLFYLRIGAGGSNVPLAPDKGGPAPGPPPAPPARGAGSTWPRDHGKPRAIRRRARTRRARLSSSMSTCF